MSNYKQFGSFTGSTFQQFCILEDLDATIQATISGMSDYRSIRKPMISFYLTNEDKVVPITHVGLREDVDGTAEKNASVKGEIVLKQHIHNFSPNAVKKVFGETFADICNAVVEKTKEDREKNPQTKWTDLLDRAIRKGLELAEQAEPHEVEKVTKENSSEQQILIDKYVMNMALTVLEEQDHIRDNDVIKPETLLGNDLGMDSLDELDFRASLESKLGLETDEVTDIEWETAGDTLGEKLKCFTNKKVNLKLDA